MAVDTALHIAQFDTANPTGATSRKEADDNFRHIKEVLKRDFANVTGAVTVTHTELNRLTGVSADVQGQLDAKAPLASPALTGTPTAPTAAAGVGSNQIANMYALLAAVASVNAQTGALTDVLVSTSTYTVSNGQRAILIGAMQQTITAPAYSDDGRWAFAVANDRTDNVINWNGAKHQNISDATMTLDSQYAAAEVVGVNSSYGWRLV